VSDPTRIRDAGSDVPDELRELFRSAEKPEPLAPAAQAALSGRIAAIAASPIPLFTRALPWLVGAAMVAAGAVAVQSRGGEPERLAEPVAKPPAVAAAPAASADPPDRAPATIAKRVKPLPRIEVQGPALTPAPKPSASPEDSLKGEAELLNKAHRALATDPSTALAIAREHAKRYPRGQLAAERELLLVQALVKLGRRSEAEARGRELREAAPNNIYEERLDTVLRGQ
jgi:hypothetical protein